MIASWLILLIALPLIGIFVGGFVLIVLAIMKSRSGSAILSGLVGILGLLFAAGILFSFLAVRAPVKQATQVSFGNAEHYAIDGGNWQVEELPFSAVSNAWSNAPESVQTTWNISLTPLLFMVCGGVALFVLALRRGFGHACAAGHGRIWPAFLALPVIALFMFGGVRFHKSQDVPPQRVAENHAQAQATIAHRKGQQQLVAQSQAAALATVHQQIDNMDIHALMDKFDAPRIVLQAPIASIASPAAMIVVTLPSTVENSYTIAALAIDDPKAKSFAKGATALWSKMKRSPKDSNPFGDTAEAVAVSEALPVKPPAAPTPPMPPTPSAIPPVKTIDVAENRVAVKNDLKADFQLAAANTEQASGTRPAWITEPPMKMGDTLREVITAGPYATPEECYRAVDVYLILKTYDHVRQLQGLPYQEAELPSVTFQNGMILADGQPFASSTNNPAWMDFRPNYLRSLGLGIDFIRRELVTKDPKNKNKTREYLETVDSSVGPMQQLYVQLEFTPAIDTEIRKVLEASERQGRFKAVGLGAGAVLCMLSMAWGLLKLDTATKGYYSKWLFLGVPATLIGGFGLLALFMETLGGQ